ncbi:MAG: hypothetical protein N2691_00510 [Patescibacteria group bacterium]|nr:hypothetical protein [Patescibacteria group bacterium]
MKHFIRHLIKEVGTHRFDYLLFFTAGTFLVISMQIFRGERLIEFLLLLAFTSFYIIWGMYHHIVDNTVHLKNIIEYILIGFTIIFLAKLLIFP